MYDKELVIDSLQKIKAMLDLITERAAVVSTPNDFLCSPGGMLRLDAICMNLIALGETVKGLDKLTMNIKSGKIKQEVDDSFSEFMNQFKNDGVDD